MKNKKKYVYNHNDYYTVYALIDPLDRLVKYIGCTIFTLKKRLNQHCTWKSQLRVNRQKANWILNLKNNLTSPIIKELSIHQTRDVAFKDEVFFIKTFKDIGHPLFNQTRGGFDVAPQTSETKKKIVAGLIRAHQKIGAYKNTYKPVSKFTLDGKIVESYDSIGDAARKNGLIHRSLCNAIRLLGRHKGYIWKYTS